MGRYTQQFIDNGYDDREVIQELCEEDLVEIGVKLKGHRKKLLLRAGKLQE